ncbi:MAG: hypothetical protein MI923_27710 [Phycisphaerales bacterium]|nr:hypothetical protein [Phycisphaerales bacterium]
MTPKRYQTIKELFIKPVRLRLKRGRLYSMTDAAETRSCATPSNVCSTTTKRC